MRTEENVHNYVVQYLRSGYPNVWYYTALDGINTTSKGKRIKENQSGQPGFPDLTIFYPKLIAIELKLELTEILTKLGKPNSQHVKNQINWLTTLAKSGFECYFAIGSTAAMDIIDHHFKNKPLKRNYYKVHSDGSITTS